MLYSTTHFGIPCKFRHQKLLLNDFPPRAEEKELIFTWSNIGFSDWKIMICLNFLKTITLKLCMVRHLVWEANISNDRGSDSSRVTDQMVWAAILCSYRLCGRSYCLIMQGQSVQEDRLFGLMDWGWRFTCRHCVSSQKTLTALLIFLSFFPCTVNDYHL